MARRSSTRRSRRARDAAVALGAGLCVCAALPPWGWWPLVLVGIVSFERLARERSPRARFTAAWWFGLGWLTPSTLWMWDFTKPGWIVAVLIMAAMVGVAGMAIPPAGWGRWLALPSALALVEYLRTVVPFGGVPLSTLPMALAASPLAPIARLGGGVALTVAAGALGVALGAAMDRRYRPAAIAAAVLAALAATTIALPRSDVVGSVDVAVVQGGGPQRTRAVNTSARAVFDRHVAATATVATPVDLVVWPENVVTVNQPLASTEEGATLRALAAELDAPILAGVVEGLGDGHFTNYSVVVDPSGALGDRYDKVRRVPFGEYIPFRRLVDALSGGAASRYVPNDAVVGTAPAVVGVDDLVVGVVISWEVFFERRARDAIGHGGEVLANPTNGSSYWLTIVQSQQVASSRLRAIESDRWVLQAAPTGFSAVVDPDGRVVERSAIGETRVLRAEVARRVGLTPAVRFGPAPWLGLTGLGLVGAWLAARRPRRRDGGDGQPSDGGSDVSRPHIAGAAGGP
ncbi:MAG: apolipoprotein N-acyltransferase [Acidimicrobiia bacterium]|nr:apolipoprotein N-acyltransferase [Acidimicrobiia bacterium]